MIQSTIASITQNYDLHGVQVRVRCPAEAGDIPATLAKRLEPFLGVPNSAAPDLIIEYQQEARSFDGGGGKLRRIGKVGFRHTDLTPHLDFWFDDAGQRLLITSGDHLLLEVRYALGKATIHLPPEYPKVIRLFTHALFSVALIQLLKTRGLHGLHAAGFGRDGKGMLIFGASGAGKTTLSVALLRAGLGFQGDDISLLEEVGERVVSHAFPDELDLTDDTLELFSLREQLAGDRKAPGAYKHAVRAEELFRVELLPRLEPTVLLFPRVAKKAVTSLHPIPASEALGRLVPNMLHTSDELVAAQFSLLAKLVSQCACYHMETGTDLDTLPDRLLSLLG